MRTDLVDTGIYLCEPDVLALFSDNWDYQVRAAPGHCQADTSVGPALGICISALRWLPINRYPGMYVKGSQLTSVCFAA